MVCGESQGPIKFSSPVSNCDFEKHDPTLMCSNNLYMQMADGAGELQEAVVRLCSLWWQKDLPGRGNMVPQMIPYLLYQATVSGTPSDCTRKPSSSSLVQFEAACMHGSASS